VPLGGPNLADVLGQFVGSYLSGVTSSGNHRELAIYRPEDPSRNTPRPGARLIKLPD
jgi:hypothetical protein